MGSAETCRSGFTFYVAVSVVFVFLVLRRSPAYAGIPPLYGGEITILLFAAMFLRRRTLARFVRKPIGLVVLGYTLLSIPYIVAAYGDVGIQSIMYASIAYYAIFVYFGYAIVHSWADQNRFIKALYYAILLSNCHSLLSGLLPLREISPLINGVPLLGNGGSSYIYFSLGIGYAIIFGQSLGRIKTTVLLLLSTAAHVFGMERGALLGIMGVGFLLLWYRKIWWRPLGHITQLSIIAIVLSLFLGICYAPESPIAQRILDQRKLFLSTISDVPELPSKSDTKAHRLQMWEQVITETVEQDPLFGQGFRYQLIDADSRIAPHNSFVSIFGRMGITGLCLALLIYIGIPLCVAVRLKTVGNEALQHQMLFYLFFAVAFLSAALFGPTLVSPYSALVASFTYGASLRCCDFAREGSWNKGALSPYSRHDNASD